MRISSNTVSTISLFGQYKAEMIKDIFRTAAAGESRSGMSRKTTNGNGRFTGTLAPRSRRFP